MAYYSRTNLVTTFYPSTFHVIITTLLAIACWAVVFGTTYINFWVGMSCSTLVLAFFSVFFGSIPFRISEVTWYTFFIGLCSAVILYGIFYIGDYLATKFFVSAQVHIADIYTIREQGNPITILFILLFITSPAEEIFWRGFLQRWTMQRFGNFFGWLIASAIYSCVHLWSHNYMLVFAAAVAGLFWGAIFWKTRTIFPCIVSHALWAIMIFIIFPITV